MTHCPACRHELSVQTDECPNCGVIFSKWSGPQSLHLAGISRPNSIRLKSLIETLSPQTGLSGLVFLILFYYGWILVIKRMPTWELFIHGVDLTFHEAGHVFFSFGGRLLTLLGGGLMQILIPTLVFGHFLYRNDHLGAVVSLFWMGENVIDVSYYVGDARAMELPLLGCEEPPCENHDWHQILNMLEMLNWDTFISRFLFGLGSVLIVSALAICAWRIWKGLIQRRTEVREPADEQTSVKQ